jgi:endonuclease YncB( thermonuclease family)
VTVRRWLTASALLVFAACSPEGEDTADTALDSSPVATPPGPVVTTETLPQVRQVIPGAAVHAPEPGATLERLPAPVVAPPPPRPVNLGIVVVEEANRLRTRRGMVTLAGTEAVASDAICRLEDGRTPACSVLARTAVRRLVGRLSVSCTLTLREDAGEDHEAPCTLGERDLSLLIVAQGWAYADASADPNLRAAETTARAEGRGLWAFAESR